MSKERLTKRVVDALQPQDRDHVVWDAQLTNFGVKITPKGRKTYFIYYRTQAGTQRRPALGTHGELTVEQAREMARDWLSRAKRGEDPSKDRKALRQSLTFSEYCQLFIEQHSKIKNRYGTRYNYQRLIDRFLVPRLGSKKVREIVRDDVARIHSRLADTPYQANRLLGLVSKVMNDAERDGHRPQGSNPCLHIQKFPEHERQRFLSREEISSLLVVLDREERQQTETAHVVGAIRLLIATGCRVGEILGLQWADIDFERCVLNLRNSKTGPRPVHLNALAIAVLERIPREKDNPFVIVGVNLGSPLVNIQKPWRRVRKLANLKSVRLHDLRHTFASLAAASGIDLHTIRKLLGHSQIRTTQRYAHLTEDHGRKATETIGQAIAQIAPPLSAASAAVTEPKQSERQIRVRTRTKD